MASHNLAVTDDPIRVLVVDDSGFHRRQIVRYLERDEKIEVVGEAANGHEAVRLNEQIRPDVVTMDLVMPVMDGITAVRKIMSRVPTNIVVFTAYSEQNAHAALDAMQAGAVDFVAKDVDRLFDDSISGAELLRLSILSLAPRRLNRGRKSIELPTLQSHSASRVNAGGKPRCELLRPKLIVIGASTGGPLAVQEVLGSLPVDYPLPILVVVHMPAGFSEVFANRMAQLSPLEVKEAREGDVLTSGTVLVAPGGRQTLVEGRPDNLRVGIRAPSGQLYRPSIDLAFSSAAEVLAEDVLAIVMTGMGTDGSLGASSLKNKGARVWTQSEDSCVVYGMPKAVDQIGLSDRKIALSEIGAALTELG